MILFLASMAHQVMSSLVALFPEQALSYRVAFVPTAANLYSDRPWIDADRNALVASGFDVEDLDLATHTSKEIRTVLERCRVLFVAGGNTFFLLQEAERCGFLEVAREFVDRGTIYIGSSAGSVLAGPTVEPIRFLDDLAEAPGLQSFDSLNLVDFVPLVHFGDECSRAERLRLLSHYYPRRSR